jgi:hypothetical protein
MNRDLYDAIKVTNASYPSNATGGGNTATVSAIIDMQGYNSLTFVVNTGSLADADATFTALLEDGADSGLSDNAAVAAGQRLGPLPSFVFSDDNKMFKVGYVGAKRYVRLTITPANNTGDVYLQITAIQAGALKQPV